MDQMTSSPCTYVKALKSSTFQTTQGRGASTSHNTETAPVLIHSVGLILPDGWPGRVCNSCSRLVFWCRADFGSGLESATTSALCWC